MFKKLPHPLQHSFSKTNINNKRKSKIFVEKIEKSSKNESIPNSEHFYFCINEYNWGLFELSGPQNY